MQGIDPTANTAEVAIQKGIPTLVEFFGRDLARKNFRGAADLIVANNVFAHVPDINDFAAGLKTALKPEGTVSLEFPHLLRLIEQSQFDTIYHEHYSYLSLAAVERILATQGLAVVEVEELATHGGSLRVWAKNADWVGPRSGSVDDVLRAEQRSGLDKPETYRGFQPRIDRIRANFLRFLLKQREAGAKVVGYGAAAKGNTLLNYCGIKGNDLISFVADLSPHKQGRYLPGSHIPVVNPAEIELERPDFIVILPWNLREEVAGQLAHSRQWGAQFVTAIPEMEVW